MCVSDLLRPPESRRSPGAVIFPPTLEGGAPADTLFYPPSSGESWRSPLWISAVKFAEKNVKFCTRLTVPSCGKCTEIDFPHIPAACLGSTSTVCVCPEFFVSDVVQGFFF